MNHILAKNKYFTNHIEWPEHKITILKLANKYQITQQCHNTWVCLIKSEYVGIWLILLEYAWVCLDLPEWLLFHMSSLNMCLLILTKFIYSLKEHEAVLLKKKKKAHYFTCLFKYTQIAAWVLWFLKTSLNQVWSGSAIVPTANLIV